MEYIELEAFRKAVRSKTMTKYDWSEEIDFEDFEKVLDAIPAADVAPVVHGRWENIRFLTTGDGRVRVGDCSSCKSIERVRNYCPNCGARMDGE